MMDSQTREKFLKNPSDVDVWVILSRFGTIQLFFSEKDALDVRNRRQKLYKAKLTDWKNLLTDQGFDW